MAEWQIRYQKEIANILWARSYVLRTRPRQNVLETSSQYTSIQIASTVKCSRYPFVLGSPSYTLRNV